MRQRKNTIGWLIRSAQDPWYSRVGDRITNKVNCLRGRHNPKMDNNDHCIWCGKDCG